MTVAHLTGQVATPATWPVADLEKRLVRALELAVIIIEEFGEAGFIDNYDSRLSFGPDKVVAETAMLAYAAFGSTSNTDVERLVSELVEVAAPMSRSRLARVDMILHPERAFKYAVPHVLLSHMGLGDSAFDAFVAKRCAVAYRTAADFPPSVRMERGWISSIWAHPEVRSAVEDSFDLRGTFAEKPYDALCASRDEAYALTHMLFYLTDFGRSRPPSFARGSVAVLADVQVALVRYMDAEDYDLAGELLMVWPQLAAPWGPVPAFCFRVLAAVEDSVGVLPCGNVDHARLNSLPLTARTEYARATGYHTAYVMGFLCATALRSGGLTVRVGHRHHRRRARQELLTLIDTSRGHWLPVFDGLSDAGKDELTSMIADIALLQALDRVDYVTAARAIGLAEQSGVVGPLQLRAIDRIGALAEAMP